MKPTFFEDYARNLSRIMMAEFIDRLRAEQVATQLTAGPCRVRVGPGAIDDLLQAVPHIERTSGTTNPA